MIHVVGEADCSSAAVESDDWIPLKVSWWPRRQVQPLYLRITGANGGEAELKVDPATGALVQVIVIDEPPALPEDPSDRKASDDAVLNKTPAIDRSPWGLRDESEGDVVGRPPVFTVMQDLAIYRRAGVALLKFSSNPAVEWMRCDGVVVGISADRTLVSVEAQLPS